MGKTLFDQKFHCTKPEKLSSLAYQFSKVIRKGDVCLLYGEIGSGKTFFVSEFVRACGGKKTLVSSPTFTLVNIYPLEPFEVYHIDLYRLQSFDEADDIFQEKWMTPDNGISFIEWAEKLENWQPQHGYKLYFEHLTKGRSLQITKI